MKLVGLSLTFSGKWIDKVWGVKSFRDLTPGATDLANAN